VIWATRPAGFKDRPQLCRSRILDSQAAPALEDAVVVDFARLDEGPWHWGEWISVLMGASSGIQVVGERRYPAD